MDTFHFRICQQVLLRTFTFECLVASHSYISLNKREVNFLISRDGQEDINMRHISIQFSSGVLPLALRASHGHPLIVMRSHGKSENSEGGYSVYRLLQSLCELLNERFF